MRTVNWADDKWAALIVCALVAFAVFLVCLLRYDYKEQEFKVMKEQGHCEVTITIDVGPCIENKR